MVGPHLLEGGDSPLALNVLHYIHSQTAHESTFSERGRGKGPANGIRLWGRKGTPVINSKTIQRAIGQYLDDEGETVVTLAEKLEVSHPTVVRWRSGDTKVIRSQHWVKLRYLLAQVPQLSSGLTFVPSSGAWRGAPAPSSGSRGRPM